MIEVEKKFRPTEEQLNALIKDAEYLGEKVLYDIYYDYPDYRLFKKQIRLRNRNGNFELKLGKSSGVAVEIENREEIEKYFETTEGLEDFIKNNLILIADYTAFGSRYKIGEFKIDMAKMSFGYEIGEIELLVKSEEDIKEAEEKILNFAKKYNLEIKDFPSKRAEYFRLIKPEIYKELYK
jgi:adenylate cyclase class IV